LKGMPRGNLGTALALELMPVSTIHPVETVFDWSRSFRTEFSAVNGPMFRRMQIQYFLQNRRHSFSADVNFFDEMERIRFETMTMFIRRVIGEVAGQSRTRQ
jgi:hypothetical protein